MRQNTDLMADLHESAEKELTRAKDAAYRFLSYRPRSRAEVEARLAEKGFSPVTIQTVLGSLDRLGYINDHEFARLWARSRIRLRGFGKRRIEQELRDKNVSREIIHEVAGEMFEDTPELDVARREAERKARTLARFEPEARRRRIAGLLERKGFSSEIIRTVLSEMKRS